MLRSQYAVQAAVFYKKPQKYTAAKTVKEPYLAAIKT